MFRFTAVSLAMVALGMTAVASEKPDEKPAVKVEIRRAEKEKADGLTEATVEGTKEKVYLHKTAELTNADIAEAKVEGTDKNLEIRVTLTKAGGEKMRKVTEEHRNKPLAIVIDGKVISAPVVKAVIGENVAITGSFTKEEAERIAKGIKSK
jgi:preprotein translocase subunit SecD